MPNQYNRKYPIDEKVFDDVQNPETCYMLGFLYADGCNFPEQNTILLTQNIVNQSIIEYFQRNLFGTTRPLQKRHQGKQVCLVITNKKISEKATELGIVKGKTKILTFPQWLPINMRSHFIRGYFDGDGNIYYNIKRGLKWSLAGTEEFLSEVQNILINELGLRKNKLLTPSIYKNTSSNFRILEYNGNIQVKKIEEWLYKDATLFVSYKKDIFKNK